MQLRTTIVSVMLLGALGAAPPAALQSRPVALSVELNVATLHAAALTTARGADDHADQPYLLASILGPGTANSTARQPSDGHLSIQLDEAVDTRPLVSLSLAPGEAARVVVSAIEDPRVDLALEGRVAAAATPRLDETPTSLGSRLAVVMAPLTGRDAHWLGSALLDVSNEAGQLRWRTFACLATCEVVSAADASTAPDTPLAGVLESRHCAGVTANAEGRLARVEELTAEDGGTLTTPLLPGCRIDVRAVPPDPLTAPARSN